MPAAPSAASVVVAVAVRVSSAVVAVAVSVAVRVAVLVAVPVGGVVTVIAGASLLSKRGSSHENSPAPGAGLLALGWPVHATTGQSSSHWTRSSIIVRTSRSAVASTW